MVQQFLQLQAAWQGLGRGFSSSQGTMTQINSSIVSFLPLDEVVSPTLCWVWTHIPALEWLKGSWGVKLHHSHRTCGITLLSVQLQHLIWEPWNTEPQILIRMKANLQVGCNVLGGNIPVLIPADAVRGKRSTQSIPTKAVVLERHPAFHRAYFCNSNEALLSSSLCPIPPFKMNHTP